MPFFSTVLRLGYASLCAGLLGATPPATGGPLAASKPIQVPEGSGTPVITDGLFSPGEWDDALHLPLNAHAELCLKHFRGVVFVGVRGLGRTSLGPSDLFLATPGSPLLQLHVSRQLFESELSPAGEPLRVRFGLTTGWTANEIRFDEKEEARLMKAGKNPMEVIQGSAYPLDGVEFAIRRTKLMGATWLLRVRTSYFAEDRPGGCVVPDGTTERSSAGWLVLRFQ